MIKLRDYQRNAVDAVFTELPENKSTLVAACVGAGKTLIQATIFQELMTTHMGARCMSLAHTQELIGQNYKAMINVWPGAPAGINSAALNRRDTSHPILFGSIQSVAKQAHRIGHMDLISVDEAHLIPVAGTSLYQTFLSQMREINPDLRIVGLSGTPFRLTTGYLHKGPSAMFDSMCYEIGIPELISKGFLVPPVSLHMNTQLDATGVKTSGGDYVAKDLQARVDNDDTTAAAVAEMVEVGREQSRRKWIVFCAGIAHSISVRDEIRRYGVTCEALDGTMNNIERASILGAYKRGEIQCLTNVNILSIGFDDPGIDLLALMRPTKSVGLYIQQCGRGLRCLGRDYDESRNAGKDSCIILDYANLVLNLGPIDAPIVKDEKPKKSEAGLAPFKVCIECRSYNHASARECSTCGAAFDIAEPASLIEPTASLLPILSVQAPEAVPAKKSPPSIHDWIYVDDVEMARHTKFGASDDAPPTLKVTYRAGRRVIREFVCLWHPEGSKPREKAVTWWRDRKLPFDAPARSGPLQRDVSHFFEAIKVKKEGEWDRVFAHKMRDRDGALAAQSEIEEQSTKDQAFLSKPYAYSPIDDLTDDDIPF